MNYFLIKGTAQKYYMKPGILKKETKPSAAALRVFRKKLYTFFTGHCRDLPWRKTEDPYCILVSEIMLQQTQVDRVKTKYEEFIAAFPNFKSLKRASLTQVYAVWQGLGYNRRALALKRIADEVLSRHTGKLPAVKEELMALPGIGKATAASILAFGFNKPEVFIETNVRSVFIHFFFSNRTDVDDTEIAALVERAIDTKNPRKWYSALMDYGTMLKKQHPNPSRKSAHYVAQSPFKGSRRQQRGAILKILLKNPNLTDTDIAVKLTRGTPATAREILSEMIRDGLIINKNGVFSIA